MLDNILDPLDLPLWGVPRIAKALGLTERQARHKIDRHLLPVEKIGGQYVSTPRRLRALIHGDWKPAP
jgi:hypothetical protein